MRVKLAKYSLLSFLSACFFFTLFSVTYAQAPVIPPSPSIDVPAFSNSSVLYSPTPIPTAIITPTNAPSATPRFLPITTSSDLEVLFNKYGTAYNVDPNWLKKIARCESNFNPQADTGLYAGMFQFAAATWISTRNSMGLDSNPDLRKNAEESIRTAAFMLAHGRQNSWPVCH